MKTVTQNSTPKQIEKVKQIVKQSGKKSGQSSRKITNLATKPGVPGGTRTHSPLLRRQLLCPIELQGQSSSQYIIMGKIE
jgi:hypothetical protein